MPPLKAINIEAPPSGEQLADPTEVWHKASLLFERMLDALTTQRGNGMTRFAVLTSKSAFYHTPGQQQPRETRAWLLCHPEIETKVHLFTQEGTRDADSGAFTPDVETTFEHLNIEQETGLLDTANYGPLQSDQQLNLLNDAVETVSLIESSDAIDPNEEEHALAAEMEFHRNYPRSGSFGPI